ncbi:MAG: HEAT repeat domain-containing protein [Planctomycetota bacterium]|nr:HEAT repeat domain-containing protein [Planctomycetota bacterium]
MTQSPLWVAVLLLPLIGCGGKEEDPESRRLVQELREGSSEQRQAATRSLRALGDRGFAALRPLFDDSDPKVRTRAAFVWKHYADGRATYVDLATRLLQDDAWVVRKSAAVVLAKAAGESPRATGVLLEAAVLERHPTVLEEIARGLGAAGASEHAAASRHLLALAAHGAPSVRAAAIHALGAVGRDQVGVESAVKTAMASDTSTLVRVRAAGTWWRLTEDAEPVLTLLEGGLLSDRSGVPEAALDGLRHLGRDAEPLVPRLVDLLDHQTLRVRAAETLGALGPVAEAALPRLTRAAASDRSSWFRQAAEKAVRSIRGS